jgi:hypothetical protein
LRSEKVIFKKISSPRVEKKLSAKNSSPRVFFFTENFLFGSRRRALRREPEGWLSPKKITHGEGPVSGSEYP